MWRKVEQYRRQWEKEHDQKDRFLKGGVVVGLSGGADSVCLMRWLLVQREKEDFPLHAVHVNHMIRGEEAKRDENFVREFCQIWEVPLTVCSENVPAYARQCHISEEEAGRELRYACMRHIAREQGCRWIAVAHHANDQAETLLFRMARGTGPAGLCGIASSNQDVIRPLLGLNRTEILHILEQIGQEYVTDSTNASFDYTRNYIRHEIVPAMEKVNLGAVWHMSQLAEQMGELIGYVDQKINLLYDKLVEKRSDGLFLAVSGYQSCVPYEQKELLRRMLFEVAGKRKDISAIHVRQLNALMENRVGKSICMPYGVLARKEYEGIVLQKRGAQLQNEITDDAIRKPDSCEKARRDISKERSEEDGLMIPREAIEKTLEEGNRLEYSLRDGGMMIFSLMSYESFCRHYGLERFDKNKLRNSLKNNCVKYFDYDTIKCNLCIRNRYPGDYFIMDDKGKKKELRRFFIDAKIPSADRHSQLLLADDAHILWILGKRTTQGCHVRNDTKRVLTVTYMLDGERNDDGR